MNQAKEGLEKKPVTDANIAAIPSTHKGKRRAGRKPGYRMESWQKEIQLASARNKDLESFNCFFNGFIHAFAGLEGRIFFIPPESGERRFFYEDHLFILRQCIRGGNEPQSATRFLFQGLNLTWKKACIGAFDLYSDLRDKKIFPEEETVRRELYRTICRLARAEGLKFGDQKIIEKNLISAEVFPPSFHEDELFSGPTVEEDALAGMVL